MRERRWRFVGCGADDCWDFFLEENCKRNAKEYLVIARDCQTLFVQEAHRETAHNRRQAILSGRTLLWIGYFCLKHTCCKMFWKIFNSVLFPTMFSQANAVTLLRSQLSDPNALCNDGSQAVYYHQQVKAKSPTTKK